MTTGYISDNEINVPDLTGFDQNRYWSPPISVEITVRDSKGTESETVKVTYEFYELVAWAPFGKGA